MNKLIASLMILGSSSALAQEQPWWASPRSFVEKRLVSIAHEFGNDVAIDTLDFFSVTQEKNGFLKKKLNKRTLIEGYLPDGAYEVDALFSNGKKGTYGVVIESKKTYSGQGVDFFGEKTEVKCESISRNVRLELGSLYSDMVITEKCAE